MKSILFAASLLFLGACNFIDCVEGKGEIVTRSFPQKDFTSFEFSSSADIELIPSDHCSIEVTTYENLMDKIEIENKAGDLEMSGKGCIRTDKQAKIKVYFKKLNEVSLEGSGNISCADTLRSETFSMEISGSGDINLLLSVDRLKAQINGSGDINMYGTAQHFEGQINGSGNLNASKLWTGGSNIQINGSGDASLLNCDHLSSQVNGSGEVKCQGSSK